MLDLADTFKADRTGFRPLAGKAVAVIFEKNSTRTRLSFEVGISQLGGQPVIVDGRMSQLGREETIEDTSRVLSRYVDAVAIRTFAQRRINALASTSSVPVINALTDEFHPCQVLADLQTIRERKGRLAGLTLTYLGDGANNMAHSLMLGGANAGLTVRISSPAGFDPNGDILLDAKRRAAETGGAIELIGDPQAAAGRRRCAGHRHLDVDGPGERRPGPGRPVPARTRSTPQLLAGPRTTPSCCTACRPTAAGRSPTRSSTVRASAVWDEAENRLHAQKALLAFLRGRACRQRSLPSPPRPGLDRR